MPAPIRPNDPASSAAPPAIAAPDPFERVRKAAIPSIRPGAEPLRAIAIHGAVTLLWVLLCLRAFTAPSWPSWSVGLVYIAYDLGLMVFVWRNMGERIDRPVRLARLADPSERELDPPGSPSDLTVVVAAYDEHLVLERTIRSLAAQSPPPRRIVIADDGSGAATATLLARRFALASPVVGQPEAVTIETVPPCGHGVELLWLRLSHGGKARALNAALSHVDTPLVLTVDADTRLADGAIDAMRRAFDREPALCAATGILTPACDPTRQGRLLEMFQSYEYVRNFLSRRAWMREDALLLLSGAFAGFRTEAVRAVGGFDPTCLVEDYELIHRLRRAASLERRPCTTRVLGDACATTSAPATIPAFLRQRRRWFAGFLQTQLRYRDMIGNPLHGRLGTRLLPVKAADTMQPLYGLAALAILVWTLAAGRFHLGLFIFTAIFLKVMLDAAFTLAALRAFRAWTGRSPSGGNSLALLALLAEPFLFQPLRHLGAAWGWVAFLRGSGGWGRPSLRTAETPSGHDHRPSALTS